MANKRHTRDSRPAASGNRPDLLNQSADFHIVEAYKDLRTNLQFVLSTTNSRAITISSAEASAGKSTVLANLAIAIGQTGDSVLVIDADLRRPTLHKVFQSDNVFGLSRILSGSISEVREVIKPKVAPNVDFISSGPIPPNPSELLGHKRMGSLIDVVSEAYAYVLIDCSPVRLVSDPLMLMKYTAGVLLVARQRQTTKEEIGRAVEKFRTIDAPILGLVMTDVLTFAGGYRYSYGYY